MPNGIGKCFSAVIEVEEMVGFLFDDYVGFFETVPGSVYNEGDEDCIDDADGVENKACDFVIISEHFLRNLFP